MTSKDLKHHEVFGTQRNVPLNYVERDDVDNELSYHLDRGQFIEIHGASKQGKTCLRRHCLSDREYAVVSCQYNRSFEELQISILKEIGFETERLREESTSKHTTIRAKATAKIPGFGEVGGSAEAGENSTEKRVIESFDIDPTDVNDIIRALENVDMDGCITIEDFHYLSVDVQKEFSSILKALYDRTEVDFVVVGVWLEESRLIVHSGDLSDRVSSVDADKWTEEELKEVISKGENYLNIDFADDFVEELIEKCYDSVFIVQGSCLRVCRIEGIESEQDSLTRVAEDISAKDIINAVVEDQGAKYRAFLRKFSNGFRNTTYEFYKWILYSVITTDVEELETGLGIRQIMSKIESVHPETDNINQGSFSQSMEKVVDLQMESNIEPIILDYNSNDRRLDVVDNRFLIWFDNQSTEELLELINVSV